MLLVRLLLGARLVSFLDYKNTDRLSRIVGFCARGEVLHEPADAPTSVLKLAVIRVF